MKGKERKKGREEEKKGRKRRRSPTSLVGLAGRRAWPASLEDGAAVLPPWEEQEGDGFGGGGC